MEYKTTHAGRTFVGYALRIGAIELVPGGRKLKSGRMSPYFFNSALFDNGMTLGALIDAYVSALNQTDVVFDTVFGPAYKGIPLAATIAVKFADQGRTVGYAFNRKEKKDHGEGGTLVGADLARRKVAIVDDVITSGGTKYEAVEMINQAGGTPVVLALAFDRMERGENTDLSAAEEFTEKTDIPVVAAANLLDLIAVLEENGDQPEMLAEINAYREKYGVA